VAWLRAETKRHLEERGFKPARHTKGKVFDLAERYFIAARKLMLRHTYREIARDHMLGHKRWLRKRWQGESAEDDWEAAVSLIKQTVNAVLSEAGLLTSGRKCPMCEGTRLHMGQACTGCDGRGYLRELSLERACVENARRLLTRPAAWGRLTSFPEPSSKDHGG
jgi:hypothetical protein